MSKAFTKESDGGLADDENDAASADDADQKIPAGSKNYMTPAGHLRMRAELKQILLIDRPALVKTVAWAASNGDRSENGDYIYGKRRLREFDRRIRFLTKRLESAEVIDPMTQPLERVVFGLEVQVEISREGRNGQADAAPQRRTFQIVGIDETDIPRGSISWISPMARVLLNARAGDVVTLETPRGTDEIEILEIRHPSLSLA